MFKNIIYINYLIIFIISIYSLIKAFDKKSNKEYLKKTIQVYIIYNIINYYIALIDLVDIGWDLLIIRPVMFISFILYLIGLIKVNK